MEKVRQFKALALSKLQTGINYYWHSGGENTKHDALIEFIKGGKLRWNDEDAEGDWHIETTEKMLVTVNGTDHTIIYNPEKKIWAV